MDHVLRGWCGGKGGWWYPCVYGEKGGYFGIKVTKEGEEKLFGQSDDSSDLQLLDVLQYALNVTDRFSGRGVMMTKFMDVLETAQDPVPYVQSMYFRRTDLSLIGPIFDAIKSEKISNLRRFHLQQIYLRSGHFTLAKAMESGQMITLERLYLSETGMEGDQCEAYATAMSSGKLPCLFAIGFKSNQIGNRGAKALGHAIQSGELKNLVRLDLSNNKIADAGCSAIVDAFQVDLALPNLCDLNLGFNSSSEETLQRLAGALESGCLNSLEVLNLDGYKPTETVAKAFTSAMASNKYLAVNVIYGWGLYPALESGRKELFKRNSRNKEIPVRIGGSGMVSAAFSKVYLCGNPKVGKTTLRHTLEMGKIGLLESWTQKRSHVERTRGIDVSPISRKGNKSSENPITLLVWDMAGQEDYHLLHNAFFPDLDSTEGKATTFIIVCSLENNLEESRQQLDYWLRFIASSCNKNSPNPRHVLIVSNNFLEDLDVDATKQQWQQVLKDQREKFASHLEIQTNPLVVDVRRRTSVKDIKARLLDHSRNSLRDEKVPKVCQFIQENLSLWSKSRQQFPVLHWEDFMREVRQRSSEQWPEETLEAAVKYWNAELWPEKTLEAATKYLNEAGALIFMDKKFPLDWGIPDRKLVVLSPNWFCSRVVGNLYLHQDMGISAKSLFRMKVDRKTGSISAAEFKKFFKSLLGFTDEWSDTDFEDLITILLWLGLSYKGRDQDMFIPSLIEEIGLPGDHWGLDNSQKHGDDQWVMGFLIEHHKNELTLAPISLWHRFQVMLAQTKYNSHPDHDFVCGRYFVTFSFDYMNVFIKVNVNKGSPTFDDINFFVKPLLNLDHLDEKTRKQRQVDLGSDLVEVLLGLWDEICPGVEYLQRVIWPWPASWSGLHVMPERNVEYSNAKKWIQEHELGRKMQWMVGYDSTITEDQLLSSKDKNNVAGSLEESIYVLRHVMEEAVELGIYPSEVLAKEISCEDSTVASDESGLASQAMNPTDKMVSAKFDRFEKKVYGKLDQLHGLAEKNLMVSREGFSEVLRKQKALHQRLQDTNDIYLQDKERNCPRFMYLGEKDSGAWTTLKEALLPSVEVRLHFLCEARYDDYRQHLVEDQRGLDISELKDWVRTIAPFLKVSLTALFIAAKVAANVVLPGIGLILPDFVQWQQASSLAEGMAMATGVSKDELDNEIIKGMGVNITRANWGPRELYGNSKTATCNLIGSMMPQAYEEKIRLRKVCLYYGDGSLHGVAWICNACLEKYRRSYIPIHEL